MRKLALYAGSFALGIVFERLKLPYIWLLYLAAVATYILLYKPKLTAVAMICCICFMLGGLRYGAEKYAFRRQTRALYGQTVNCVITATDFQDGESFPGTVCIKGKEYKVYVTAKTVQNVRPGDMVRATVRFTDIKSAGDEFFDYGSYLHSLNISLAANAENETIAGRYKGAMAIVYNARCYLDSISEKYFTNDAKGLFSAIALGDKRYISEELSSDLQRAGQKHIAVVSGMHLSVMLWVVMMLLNKTIGNSRMKSIASIGAVIFITAVTGMGASVVRSCIMCIVFQLSAIFNRESDPITALFCAVGLMLGFNPYYACNIGFVLSVLSVLGILLYSKKITLFLQKRFPEKLSEVCAVSLSAQILTVPVGMIVFSTVSPYALIANLFVFLLASALVIFSMAFAAVAYIPLLGFVIAQCIKATAYAISAVCRAISLLPFSLIETKLPAAFIVILFSVLAAALGLWRQDIEKNATEI